MSNIITITNVLGSFATNCYTVANTETREAIIVDPAAKASFLIQMYSNQNLKPVAVLLTHGHFDHIGALPELKEAFPDIRVYACDEEQGVLESKGVNLSEAFGHAMTVSADEYLHDMDEITLLGQGIKCFHVPGHTKGGMCYYFETEKMVFSGDTLFAGSIGRSDFPTGDEAALLKGIRDKLFSLPEDVTVYPGHNSRTTIKREKDTNPYFM